MALELWKCAFQWYYVCIYGYICQSGTQSMTESTYERTMTSDNIWLQIRL